MTGTETSTPWGEAFQGRQASDGRVRGSLEPDWVARSLLLLVAVLAGVVGYFYMGMTSDETMTDPLPREWQWSPEGPEYDKMFSTPQTRGAAPPPPLTTAPPR